MVRRIRRSTLISLVAVIALLGLGIGYAAWTDDIEVNGTVNTGNLDQGWESSSVQGEVDPLNVGECAPSVASAGDKTMTVTITDAYPGYSCTFNGLIRQNGTIPGILNTATVDNHNPGVLTVSACHNLTLPIQIGADRTCRSTVTFDSSNNAHQNSVFTFDIDLAFSTS